MNRKLKVLAIGDLGDNILIFKKFSKKCRIHLINFPRKQAELLTYSEENVEFFDTILISKQVKKIQQIKDEYDISIVMSWAGARVAFLAGLNYVMYFTGGDITTPPFLKKPKSPYLKSSVSNHNFLERWFYKKVFDSAIFCIAPTEEYFAPLKKFKKNAIRMDRFFIDSTIFNENVKPINLKKNKFTFFCPQKIGMEKGYDTIWNALKICKSDFEVLQVNWFTERNDEEKEFNRKLMKNMPKQVKLIPLIKRDEMPKYYMFADAVLGQMRAGIQGGIERDASFCKRPVICYTNPDKPLIIEGKKIIPPFPPQTQNPEDLAELIDKIVISESYRNELAELQNKWAKSIWDPNLAANEWEELLEKIHKEFPAINRKESKIKLKIINFILDLLEKHYYKNKMKDRNIKGWGMEEYSRLTK